MRTKKAASEDVAPMRPTLSPEVRENQMISLAMDLVEKRLREGTASSAETTHFLKLATVKSELEKKKQRTPSFMQKPMLFRQLRIMLFFTRRQSRRCVNTAG